MTKLTAMLKRFWRNCRASVAPTFAVAAIPLIVTTGAVVDYSRAYDQKTVVQDALDGAALAAGKKLGIWTDTQVKTEASNFYNGNIGNKVDTLPALTSAISAATLTLTTQLHVKTNFLGMIGLKEFVFNLEAQSTQAMGTLEVAMALDNSGSMSGTKIATLKSAAAELATTLWGLGATSTKPNPIQISIVPFAAAVNVGPSFGTDSTATWLDKTGLSSTNGGAMEDYGASGVSNLTLFAGLKNTTWAGCVEERPQPYDATDDTASTGTPNTLFVPMFAPDEPDDLTCSSSSCPYAGASSSKYRYNGAVSGGQSYNNYLPDDGDQTTCAADFQSVTISKASPGVFTSTVTAPSAGQVVVLSTTNTLPGGLTAGRPYYVVSPSGKTFKVSATSGGSAINTTSSGSGTHYFNKATNFTCDSGNAGCDGSGVGDSEEDAFAGKNLSTALMCKYGTASKQATPVSITVGGLDGGPNFMCTTPAITPLSTSSSTVSTAITNLVSNGATNILAGLTWAWRTLSPAAPFTTGRAYSTSDNQKIIILMTDGENTYYPNSSFLKSWYASFGYTEENRLGAVSNSSDDIEDKMNDRTLQACANAKAAGIRIYTVGFEINSKTSNDPATALALLQNCASDTTKYFDAQDEDDLTAAFTAIGDDISLLRLSL